MIIGKVLGIRIRINPLFLCLFLIIIAAGKIVEGLIVFGVVIIHEMAHTVTAVNYGYKVREIELLPFGGVARIEEGLEGDPSAEIYIAMAGPLMNLCMVGVAYVIGALDIGNRQWFPFFVQSNFMIALFNLLPAYPLDGGRVYRAFLAARVGVKESADRGLTLSRYIALFMVCLGLLLFYWGFTGINLIVIGVFLLVENFREKGNTMFLFLKYLNRKKEKLSIQRLMVARQVVVLEDVMVKEVVRFFVPQNYHMVIRVDQQHKITGVFTETEIISVLLEGGLNTTLGEL